MSSSSNQASRHDNDEPSLRARRIAEMLARWEAEEVADEPDWDVEEIGRISLREPTERRSKDRTE